jgi:hypothetical protein
MYAYNGALYGNGKENSDRVAWKFVEGDRLGVRVDLDKGSLRFFKNGVEHGLGWGAGTVTGPVVLAMQAYFGGSGSNIVGAAAPGPRVAVGALGAV